MFTMLKATNNTSMPAIVPPTPPVPPSKVVPPSDRGQDGSGAAGKVLETRAAKRNALCGQHSR
jgi:hypothetical protein